MNAIMRILTGILCFETILVFALPRPRADNLPAHRFMLPDNATTIRDSIDTSFNCDSKPYGYYADTENDCQLFHVCLPIAYSPEATQTFMWSFICPQDTIFNQERFTCTRVEDSIPCQESARFYSLNDNFGRTNSVEPESVENELETTNSAEELEQVENFFPERR